jgi:RNA polymerase sigma-70 factor (family 1)
MISSLNNRTEAELVALMKDDHRGAFNEIYERYWLRLYMAAVKRVKSKDDAKDLVQDLFFSIWMKRESLIINTSLSSYLYTAIKYKVINYIESNIVKGNYLESLNKALIDYDNQTNETISARDLQQFLDSRINDLSPKVKQVFELSRKENLSISEIALKLNVSDQTVKNQLSKALKILRIELSDISATFLFFFFLNSWVL